jgi:hypothetical protein
MCMCFFVWLAGGICLSELTNTTESQLYLVLRSRFKLGAFRIQMYCLIATSNSHFTPPPPLPQRYPLDIMLEVWNLEPSRTGCDGEDTNLFRQIGPNVFSRPARNRVTTLTDLRSLYNESAVKILWWYPWRSCCCCCYYYYYYYYWDQEVIPARNAMDCSWARFCGEWRVATTHPISIRTVHLLTGRYSKCLMFSVCV